METILVAGTRGDHITTRMDRELKRLLSKSEDLKDWERFNLYHLTHDQDSDDKYHGTPFD